MLSHVRRCLPRQLNVSTKRHFASALRLTTAIDDFEVENERVLDYLPGSKERQELEAALADLRSNVTEVPLVIDGKRIKSELVQHQVAPFDHKCKVAQFYWATPDVIQTAIDASQKRREEWEKVPLSQKIKLLLKAADLVSGKYRAKLNAATILGQSKTIIQAEIDAAAELADFFRFNAFFAKELTGYQPISEDKSKVKNTFRYRGLEGFVAAVSPFNFTAIGGNLASAPTMMGNVVLWKPSDTAILSNYIIFQLLEEAGLPPGVINFLPSDGPAFGNTVLSSPHFAGLNFTGSVATFRHLWKQSADNLELYRNFPRLIGECGGKNFHFLHPTTDLETAVPQTIKSAFEYGGQKCSACSRAYVPESLWPRFKDQILDIRKQLKVGSPLEYDTFHSAVIDGKAFNRIKGYIDHAKNSSSATILGGGHCDDSVGFYIEPTIIQTTDPRDKIMTEEIFGPVLSIYVYKDSEIESTLDLVNSSTNFALTGAIFGQDDAFLSHATDKLKMAAGNFYVNDKSTGSVVGQQPFGGGRLSGTNDKAGGPHYLLRWASPQNVKETFVPVTSWTYPYMSS
ncbi:Delta-1-pyrroline-5-carboxylate dehydrogenase, mitochondrial [Halotydeus destructor]|nr:Delta-1-pyrroline-5-carboxylate dehydrogenase, mitochondrial [Halotydeus destructor]